MSSVLLTSKQKEDLGCYCQAEHLPLCPVPVVEGIIAGHMDTLEHEVKRLLKAVQTFRPGLIMNQVDVLAKTFRAIRLGEEIR